MSGVDQVQCQGSSQAGEDAEAGITEAHLLGGAADIDDPALVASDVLVAKSPISGAQSWKVEQ